MLDNLSTGFRWAMPKRRAAVCVGDTGDLAAGRKLIIARHEVDAIIHFAASIVVPDSVADPLGYYRNNTVNSRALIEAAVTAGVKHFIFSSTAAVYGKPTRCRWPRTMRPQPMSPYGSSKLMTRDHAARRRRSPMASRYVVAALFQCRGRRPPGPHRAIHQGRDASDQGGGGNFARPPRQKMDVFGTDYPTPDGTCIRDYIHVSDLAGAHSDALPTCAGAAHRRRSTPATAAAIRCLEVIDTVKKVSGVDFRVDLAERRPGDPAQIVAASSVFARRSAGSRITTIWTRSSPTRWREKKLMQMRNPWACGSLVARKTASPQEGQYLLV